MKNKIFIVLIFTLPFLFIACNQKVEIQYYDTGEVYRTEKRINEHEVEVCIYLKNGQIVLEGIVRDSLREGQWNYYYNDGVLRGELIFSKDKMIRENIRYPILLDFKDNPSEFKIGNTYQFRILGISTFFSIQTPIRLGYESIYDDINNVQYWLKITPQKAGNDTITVIIKDFELPYTDIDTIFFPIKVVDGAE